MTIGHCGERHLTPAGALEAAEADLKDVRPVGSMLRTVTYRVARPVPSWFFVRLVSLGVQFGFTACDSAQHSLDCEVFRLLNKRTPR